MESLKAVQLNVRVDKDQHARKEQQRSTAHANEGSQFKAPDDCPRPDGTAGTRQQQAQYHAPSLPSHFSLPTLPPCLPVVCVCMITYQAVLTGVAKLPPLAEGETHVHALQTVPHLAGRRAHKGHDDAVVVVVGVGGGLVVSVCFACVVSLALSGVCLLFVIS